MALVAAILRHEHDLKKDAWLGILVLKMFVRLLLKTTDKINILGSWDLFTRKKNIFDSHGLKIFRMPLH